MTWSLTLAELPRAATNSKPHHYKHNLQKTKELPKTWGFKGNSLKISEEKRAKTSFSSNKKKQWNTLPLNTIHEYGLCNQEEVDRIKIQKNIHIKTVGFLQD